MSASSYRYGFDLPPTTRVAMEIHQGSQIGRRRTPGEHPLLNIGSGDPAFVTPPHICDAAKNAIDAGKTHYERNAALKEAIASKLQRDHGIFIDPDEGLVVTPGAHVALFEIFRAWITSGDEVIMADPGSYYYANTVANGGGAVRIPLRKENGFRLDPEEVEAHITPRTKILALTNPEAPAASVQSHAQLRRLAEIAIRHNLIVVSDELYEGITYDRAAHLSIGSLPGMHDRTITVNGLSKTWAMTGWRVGYAAGDPRLLAPVKAINHLNCISLNSIAQFAALEALLGPQEFIQDALTTYRQRRDLVVRRIKSIEGFDCLEPEGTYYVWVDMRGLGMSDIAFQRTCVEKFGITFNPGTAFGPSGYGFVRLSCSPSEEVLHEGLDRLAAAATLCRSELVT